MDKLAILMMVRTLCAHYGTVRVAEDFLVVGDGEYTVRVRPSPSWVAVPLEAALLEAEPEGYCGPSRWIAKAYCTTDALDDYLSSTFNEGR